MPERQAYGSFCLWQTYASGNFDVFELKLRRNSSTLVPKITLYELIKDF
ncbi:hypothetical protein [Bacillus pseudomycoides]|nr:hypothetical protein [Bacillus pseudomycoides]